MLKTINYFYSTTLTNCAKKIGLKLSDVQNKKMLDYLTLMIKWNKIYNLTALRNIDKMIIYHLLDSLTAMQAFTNMKNILDVGSGCGLPGIVLAIWMSEINPIVHISMVDKVHKKTAFLKYVKAQLHLKNISIYTERVENLQTNILYDAITSRAFAKLKKLVECSSHLLQQTGSYIVFKSIKLKEEINNLPSGWHITNVQNLKIPEVSVKRYLVFLKKI